MTGETQSFQTSGASVDWRESVISVPYAPWELDRLKGLVLVL